MPQGTIVVIKFQSFWVFLGSFHQSFDFYYVGADLPGFYYDAEKNRYFPNKGPVPGSRRANAAAASSSSDQKLNQVN